MFVSGEVGRLLYPLQGSLFGPPVFNLDQLDIRGRVLHARVARLFSSLCGNSLAVLCSEEHPSRVFLHVWSFYWVNLSSLPPQDLMPTRRLCQEPLASRPQTLLWHPSCREKSDYACTHLPWIQLQHTISEDTEMEANDHRAVTQVPAQDFRLFSCLTFRYEVPYLLVSFPWCPTQSPLLLVSALNTSFQFFICSIQSDN